MTADDRCWPTVEARLDRVEAEIGCVRTDLQALTTHMHSAVTTLAAALEQVRHNIGEVHER